MYKDIIISSQTKKAKAAMCIANDLVKTVQKIPLSWFRWTHHDNGTVELTVVFSLLKGE